MDKSFRLQGIEFEWDERKYAINVQKHGIRFEEAAEVFFDPDNIFGTASTGAEFREFVLGYSQLNPILLVVFVERKPRMRIFSARRATTK